MHYFVVLERIVLQRCTSLSHNNTLIPIAAPKSPKNDAGLPTQKQAQVVALIARDQWYLMHTNSNMELGPPLGHFELDRETEGGREKIKGCSKRYRGKQ